MTEEQKKKLQKLVKDHSDGKSFSELKDVVATQQSKEFPDYGKDVPEGTYFVMGKYDVHQWKNRRGNTSDILTAFVCNEGGDVYEIAFASFCKREWDFVRFNRESREYDKVEDCNPLLPFYPSLSQRTDAVSKVAALTAIKVKHARGHFDNPNNTRVFDFDYTWVEKA